MSFIDKALMQAAKIALSTGADAPDELAELRLNTCRGCEFLNAEKMQCRSCGCYVEAKVTMMHNYNPKKAGRKEVTHCPQGLWGDKETANQYRKLDGLPLL